MVGCFGSGSNFGIGIFLIGNFSWSSSLTVVSMGGVSAPLYPAAILLGSVGLEMKLHSRLGLSTGPSAAYRDEAPVD